MKKGLLSLLVVALTVVGCQDYDDQFDSLNKEILALKTDLSTITGLQTSVTAISDEIKKLMAAGSATDVELAKVLTDIGLVKAAVAAIDVSGIDDVKTQTADLNTEIDDILSKLTKLAAATGGTHAGNINITNLVQLTAAEDIIDVTTDGPLMTITGSVNITAGQTHLKLAANLVRIQAILNKLKVVSGNVTVTGVDIAMTADELLYVTGSLSIAGKSSMALPKLNTVDGSVDFDLYGDLSYPLLGSAGGGLVLSSTGTITSVDLSALSTGVVTTGSNVLVLPLATSVKVGSLPASVTLAIAETVEAHGVAALGAMSMSAPKATAVTIKAGSIAGTVTVSANLAAITLHAASSSGLTQIHGASVSADLLTVSTNGLTVSATTFTAEKYKTGTGTMTLVSVATAAFPAMTTITGSFTGASVTAFTAPKLDTGTGPNVIDLKAGASVSVKTIGHLNSLTDSNTIASLTVASQANDIVLDHMVKLVTLGYTGKVITGTLTISSTMVSLTTLTLGSDSLLQTLTVSGTNIATLSTDGKIVNTTISHNAKLATLNFGHTHALGQNPTTFNLLGNTKLAAVDMSSLEMVGQVEITGNSKLATFVAPSSSVLAQADQSIVVTMTGNGITGTYSPSVLNTGTTPLIPFTASSAAITSWKTFIDAYNAILTVASVTYNLDIDNVLLGSSTDGKFNDGAFSGQASSTTDATPIGTISTTAYLDKF